MTDSIQAKRERRSALAKETRNLLDKATGASDWGDDQQAVYDSNITEIERLDAEITRHQKVMDLQAEKDFADMGVRGAEDHTPSGSAMFAKWMRGGDKALSAEEWMAVRNTMSTTTDAEGGYTVPEEWAASVLEALKAYGGMRSVATILRTSDGVQINYPTSDGTAEVGEIIAENQPATDLDPEFGTKSLVVYKFSSKVITVPIELLQDSAVNVEQFVQGRIEQRLGRITNQMYTTGSGNGQPHGIMPTSTAGKTGAVSGTAVITYDDLLDLEHSIDPAYRGSPAVRWMMNDAMLKLVRKLKDEDKRPLFLPSYDAGIRGGVPAELMGYQIQINQDVAAPAVLARSILFGDMSKYIIRDAMNMSLFRFTDSAYAKKGQVGFLAWMRSGGNLIDVGGAVKHFAHGAAS